MTSTHHLDAFIASLPTIPEDAGPEWRDWIRLRDLLLRARAMTQNIRMKECKL